MSFHRWEEVTGANTFHTRHGFLKIDASAGGQKSPNVFFFFDGAITKHGQGSPYSAGEPGPRNVSTGFVRPAFFF